jgi:TonB family protein
LTRFPAAAAALALLLLVSPASGQTRGAELVRQQKPVYPEMMAKGLRQGNALLIGRIDAQGRVQDLRAVGSTLPDFVDPAVAAVRTWAFKPALADGKPVEIAANIGVRFRFESAQRGQLSSPILGDIAVFPADAAGQRAAPEGFPIRRGVDPKLRAEPVLDLSPAETPRKVHVRAEAVSPAGRRVVLIDRSVDVGPKKAEVSFPFSAPIGADWPDGVWLIRFTADGGDAGGGQFWLARDPVRFDFAAALRQLRP